jgi:hypothetical protein
MTGPEHYQEAETQAESAAHAIDDRMFDDARVSLGLAQVHATLALAAATGVNSANKDERQEWQYVAGVKL